jgi:cytoplasmic iron level regulating protein YaaA (DUF328/UPF0246 family)
VLLFLPPSEGKTEPSTDEPFDPDSLAFAGFLGEARESVLEALAGLASIDREEAVGLLGISPGQAGDIDLNAGLRRAPAGPAIEVYSGVLYDRLDFPTLSAKAKKRAAECLLIASALWGALRPTDRIPWYRCSMKAKLPGLGGLAALWRPLLLEAFDDAGIDREGELVVDLRSAAYSAAWKPASAELVSVRAFTEKDGTRKPVSHMAKAARGEVARIALEAADPPSDPAGLAGLVEAAGRRVELSDGFLDVIEVA